MRMDGRSDINIKYRAEKYVAHLRQNADFKLGVGPKRVSELSHYNSDKKKILIILYVRLVQEEKCWFRKDGGKKVLQNLLCLQINNKIAKAPDPIISATMIGMHLASRELFKSLYLDSEQSNSTVIVDINRSVTLISSTFWVEADCLRDNLNLRDFGTGSKKMCLYCFYIMLARHASFSGYTFLGFFSYRFAATTREAFAVFGVAAPPSQRFLCALRFTCRKQRTDEF
uniref:Uncharacterized protein n=1 Tax=Glossina palpalis gambiensis TaxID=67801 RepID=A0A1B0BY10_9MUSC